MTHYLFQVGAAGPDGYSVGEGGWYEPTAMARQVDTSCDATTPGPDGPVLADRIEEAIPMAIFFLFHEIININLKERNLVLLSLTAVCIQIH